MPLLISGFIVSAFLTLSTTAEASPRGGVPQGNFRGGHNFAFNQNGRSFRRHRRVFSNSLSGLFIEHLRLSLRLLPIWITGRITTSNTRILRPRIPNPETFRSAGGQ